MSLSPATYNGLDQTAIATRRDETFENTVFCRKKRVINGNTKDEYVQIKSLDTQREEHFFTSSATTTSFSLKGYTISDRFWFSASPFQEARTAISSHKNLSVSTKASYFLETLEKVVYQWQNEISDNNLPRILPLESDEDSIWLEWIFPNFRFGFSIDNNPEDSGWYIVSNEELGSMSASGLLPEADLEPLLNWLLYLIILRY